MKEILLFLFIYQNFCKLQDINVKKRNLEDIKSVITQISKSRYFRIATSILFLLLLIKIIKKIRINLITSDYEKEINDTTYTDKESYLKKISDIVKKINNNSVIPNEEKNILEENIKNHINENIEKFNFNSQDKEKYKSLIFKIITEREEKFSEKIKKPNLNNIQNVKTVFEFPGLDEEIKNKKMYNYFDDLIKDFSQTKKELWEYENFDEQIECLAQENRKYNEIMIILKKYETCITIQNDKECFNLKINFIQKSIDSNQKKISEIEKEKKNFINNYSYNKNFSNLYEKGELNEFVNLLIKENNIPKIEDKQVILDNIVYIKLNLHRSNWQFNKNEKEVKLLSNDFKKFQNHSPLSLLNYNEYIYEAENILKSIEDKKKKSMNELSLCLSYKIFYTENNIKDIDEIINQKINNTDDYNEEDQETILYEGLNKKIKTCQYINEIDTIGDYINSKIKDNSNKEKLKTLLQNNQNEIEAKENTTVVELINQINKEDMNTVKLRLSQYEGKYLSSHNNHKIYEKITQAEKK